MNKNNVRQHAIASEAVQHELMQFLEFHHARRLSRNLRSLLLEFLMYEGGEQSAFLKDLLYDLRGLYMLLDVLEEEQGEFEE